MSDDAKTLELIRSLLRPPAKCGPEIPEERILTLDEMDVREAKLEWIALRISLGLSRRAAARLLDYSASAVDAWESMTDLDRSPPKYVFKTIVRRVAEESSPTNKIPRTGT